MLAQNHTSLYFTNLIDHDQSTVVTASLEDLLNLANEADVENWSGQLDVTKMTWALLHILIAGCALKATINGTKLGVAQAFVPRTLLEVILYKHVSLC